MNSTHQNGNTPFRNKTILALSTPLSVLIIFASCTGLFTPGFYSRETFNWTVQSIGQDWIDLFLITPFFIITSILAFRKSRIGIILWSGALFYLVYTYTIFCFDVHFNNLFVIYCLIYGLSFYSFMYFLLLHIKEPVENWFGDKIPVKTISIFMMVTAVLFYFVWLSEIIPALINNVIPRNLTEVGSPTNPIQVIDLSVFLPGLLIVAILLWKKKRLGLLLAPVFLVFCILMDITIGALAYMMKTKGLEGDVMITIIFTVLALFSTVLLILFLRNMKGKELATSEVLKTSDV